MPWVDVGIVSVTHRVVGFKMIDGKPHVKMEVHLYIDGTLIETAESETPWLGKGGSTISPVPIGMRLTLGWGKGER